MRSVGVIGLGEIGSGVAKGVAAAGLPLAVCDVDPAATELFAASAEVAPSPRELASRSDVVVVAVVTDGQVLSVLDPDMGALAGARRGSSVVVLSTVKLSTLEIVAGWATPHGITLVDCGVTGGPSAAAEGQLVSMVGGDPAAVADVTDVLDAFSSLVVHMGPLGAGLRAKLARNVITYGAWLAAYEGQLLAEAAGVELAKLAQVVRASEKRIGGTSTLMFRESVAAPFPPDADANLVAAMATGARLAHKDLRAAIELAASLGIDVPLAELADASCGRIFGVPQPATEDPQ